MKKRSLLFSGLMLASATSVQAMPYGFYDARSVAMGNVSVATGGTTTAALSNPGMLTVNENDDTFALLLPAVGVVAIDNGDVIDSIDEFQELETEINRLLNLSNPGTGDALDLISAINQEADIVRGLDGSNLALGLTPNAAIVYSGDDYAWGVTFRGNVLVSVGLADINVPISNIAVSDVLNGSLTTGNITEPDATIKAVGVLTTEVGLPMGTDFNVAGMQLSVGIIPKVVSVTAIEYSETISTIELDDVVDQDETDLGSFTTVDAGVTLNVIDSLRVGLVAKNLISETKTLNPGTLNARDINFDTQLRAGAAFDTGFLTVAADIDLTKNKPIATENESQSLSIGVELDTFEIFQLRAGYQTNLVSGSTDPDLLSVGFGLWLGFHIDAAVVVGDDSSLGGFVQTGFRF